MKIAVLTSGGDSAGMNAVVRAVVKAGILKCVLLTTFFPNIGEAEGWP
jgi:6-phosphofructokinase